MAVGCLRNSDSSSLHRDPSIGDNHFSVDGGFVSAPKSDNYSDAGDCWSSNGPRTNGTVTVDSRSVDSGSDCSAFCAPRANGPRLDLSGSHVPKSDDTGSEGQQSDSPGSEGPGLKQWETLDHMWQQIPLHYQNKFVTGDLCIVAMSVTDDEYILLGTNTGSLYWYDHHACKVHRFRTEGQLSAVTRVTAVTSCDHLLAAGHVTGDVTMYVVPRLARGDVPDIVRLAELNVKKNLTFHLESLHACAISALFCTRNAGKLFSGDVRGNVFVTEIDYFQDSTVSQCCVRESEAIVQLDYRDQLLLVATRGRCCVVNTLTGTTKSVGNKPRKVCADLGGCFLSTPVNAFSTGNQSKHQQNQHKNQLSADVSIGVTADGHVGDDRDDEGEGGGAVHLVAARGSLRLVTATVDGHVFTTVSLKSGVRMAPQIQLIDGARISAGTTGGLSEPMRQLMALSERHLVAHNGTTLFVIDLVNWCVSCYCDQLTNILDMTVSCGSIYILCEGRRLFRISEKPFEIDHNFNCARKNRSLSAELDLGELIDELRSSLPVTQVRSMLTSVSQQLGQQSVLDTLGGGAGKLGSLFSRRFIPSVGLSAPTAFLSSVTASAASAAFSPSSSKSNQEDTSSSSSHRNQEDMSSSSNRNQEDISSSTNRNREDSSSSNMNREDPHSSSTMIRNGSYLLTGSQQTTPTSSLHRVISSTSSSNIHQPAPHSSSSITHQTTVSSSNDCLTTIVGTSEQLSAESDRRVSVNDYVAAVDFINTDSVSTHAAEIAINEKVNDLSNKVIDPNAINNPAISADAQKAADHNATNLQPPVQTLPRCQSTPDINGALELPLARRIRRRNQKRRRVRQQDRSVTSANADPSVSASVNGGGNGGDRLETLSLISSDSLSSERNVIVDNTRNHDVPTLHSYRYSQSSIAPNAPISANHSLNPSVGVAGVLPSGTGTIISSPSTATIRRWMSTCDVTNSPAFRGDGGCGRGCLHRSFSTTILRCLPVGLASCGGRARPDCRPVSASIPIISDETVVSMGRSNSSLKPAPNKPEDESTIITNLPGITATDYWRQYNTGYSLSQAELESEVEWRERELSSALGFDLLSVTTANDRESISTTHRADIDDKAIHPSPQSSSIITKNCSTPSPNPIGHYVDKTVDNTRVDKSLCTGNETKTHGNITTDTNRISPAKDETPKIGQQHHEEELEQDYSNIFGQWLQNSTESFSQFGSRSSDTVSLYGPGGSSENHTAISSLNRSKHHATSSDSSSTTRSSSITSSGGSSSLALDRTTSELPNKHTIVNPNHHSTVSNDDNCSTKCSADSCVTSSVMNHASTGDSIVVSSCNWQLECMPVRVVSFSACYSFAAAVAIDGRVWLCWLASGDNSNATTALCDANGNSPNHTNGTQTISEHEHHQHHERVSFHSSESNGASSHNPPPPLSSRSPRERSGDESTITANGHSKQCSGKCRFESDSVWRTCDSSWRVWDNDPALCNVRQLSVSPDGRRIWRLDNDGVVYTLVSPRISTGRPSGSDGSPVGPILSGSHWLCTARDVVFISMDVSSVWYIKRGGSVCMQRDLTSTRLASPEVRVDCSKSVVHVAARHGVVWACTECGEVLCRLGVSSAEPVGSSWAQLDCGVLSVGAVYLGAGNTGWVVDSYRRVFVLLGVSGSLPRGVDGVWRKVLGTRCGSSSSVSDHQAALVSAGERHRPMVCVEGSVAWYCEPRRHFVLKTRQPISAVRWRLFRASGSGGSGSGWGRLSRKPQWRQVLASGVYRRCGELWALSSRGQLFGGPVDSGQLKNVGLPEKNCQIQCIAAAPSTLWLLTTSGQLFVRDGLDHATCGTSWLKFNLDQIEGCRLVHVAVGTCTAWACTAAGTVMIRMGPTGVAPRRGHPASQAFQPVWVTLDPPKSTLFTKVYVCAGDNPVWALDTLGRVWRRGGISDHLLAGTEWTLLGPSSSSSSSSTSEAASCDRLSAVELAVCGDNVSALTDRSGAVYRWLAASHTWCRLPGNFQHVSASINGQLWSVHNNCIYTMEETLVRPGVSQQPHTSVVTVQSPKSQERRSTGQETGSSSCDGSDEWTLVSYS